MLAISSNGNHGNPAPAQRPLGAPGERELEATDSDNGGLCTDEEGSAETNVVHKIEVEIRQREASIHPLSLSRSPIKFR